MTELLSAYSYCVCQAALLSDDIYNFFEQLDLSSKSYEQVCMALIITLKKFYTSSMPINYDVEQNIIDFIDLLKSGLGVDKNKIRNDLLFLLRRLDVYSMQSNILKEKTKAVSYYIAILKSHSMPVPVFDSSDDSYFMQVRGMARTLIYNDYLIINELLKEKQDRDYSFISLHYSSYCIKFFLKNKSYRNFTNGDDFRQLCDYLKKSSFEESTLEKFKQKVFSILKK